MEMIPEHVGQWHEPYGHRRSLEPAELPDAVIKDAEIMRMREKMPVLKDGQRDVPRGDEACGARQDKSMGSAHDGPEPRFVAV